MVRGDSTDLEGLAKRPEDSNSNRAAELATLKCK